MKSLHPISEKEPPQRTLAFWKRVRWFIEIIWSLFGGPEHIAAMTNLSRHDHGVLASWLRKAEALVRRLLAIDAADVQIEEKKYKARLVSPRIKKTRLFHADEPHRWRVSFRMSPPKNNAAKLRTLSAAASHRRLPEAWPLAKRFEALLRVFDAPEAYVKRVARRLRRQPDALSALIAPISFAGFEDIFEPLRPILADAYGAFPCADSS